MRDYAIIRARIRALSDGALRSEYVSACARGQDLIDAVIRECCAREAEDRGIVLRDRKRRRAALVRAVLGEMDGF